MIPTPADMLDRAAAIYRDRTPKYGDSWRGCGEALLALFDGAIPEITTADAAQRLFLLVHCADLLRRYAVQLDTGGDRNSAEDLINYAAMLAAETKE